jgi:hypothetical protein
VNLTCAVASAPASNSMEITANIVRGMSFYSPVFNPESKGVCGFGFR